MRPGHTHDNPDLRLYLGVARLSLGGLGVESGGWSIVPWLARGIPGKNFLWALGTICSGSVGCVVANSFQSMGEAPRMMGPILSMSLVLDVAFVPLTVLHREIKQASMIRLRRTLLERYGTTALSTSSLSPWCVCLAVA